MDQAGPEREGKKQMPLNAIKSAVVVIFARLLSYDLSCHVKLKSGCTINDS